MSDTRMDASLSDTDKINKNRPPTQATKYLDGCAPIIQAWHERLLAIKNNQQSFADIDYDEKLSSKYKFFFSIEISSSDAAKLKRVQHMDDVAIQPAFIALWQQVEPRLIEKRGFISDTVFAGWLAVAWVLAQVRSVDERYRVQSDGKSKRTLDNTLARVAGQKTDDRPFISSLRFEKLTSARRPDDFIIRLARLVAHLQQQGQPLNIIWLANDILHWFADYQGSNYRTPKDKLLVQWALAYYQSDS